jgi:hypothetical protein
VTDPGPSAGHQFRFAVTVQGSYLLGDDPQYYDSDPNTESEPFWLTVRAWDLSAACRAAAQTPSHQWKVDE